MPVKHPMILTGMALAAIGLSACKDETRTKTETTEKRVTAEGTTIERKTESDVKIDEQGNRTGTVETETTVDPEGLLNKETTEERYEEVQE
ncbi:MAG TPA: hypothetical protein VGD95_06080 [Micavibrio sp.]